RGRHDARRPVRPALTRDYIIRVALDIVDTSGINALSMRKLGAELGVDPMAVYYHLPNKAALFDGIVELVYAEIDLDYESLAATGTWRDQISTYMRRLRDVLRHHPNVLPAIATRPAYTPSVLALGDRALGVLQEVGFSGRAALH